MKRNMAARKSYNTFYLESPKPFRPCELKKLTEEYLEETLNGNDDPFPSHTLPALALRLATELREKVVTYEFLRLYLYFSKLKRK